MPDSPKIAHSVSRGGSLRMVAVVDHGQTVVLGDIAFTVGHADTQSLRTVETVEVDLRLGVVVGRVG